MTDQNRKTLRSFYCRDYLWELFEQMTQELGCSMDYLVNESMRLYARSRDYSPGEAAGANGGQPQQSPDQWGQQQPYNHGGGLNQRQQNGRSQQSPSTSNPGSSRGRSGMNHRTFQRVPAVGPNQQQAQQPQQPQKFGQRAPQNQPQQRSPGGPPPPPPRPGQQNFSQHDPQSGPGQGFGGQQSAQGPLYLIFNNNRYVIDAGKFVVGRGSQQTDLTIRDGNISRKHCAIIHRNGTYYIKDLDSTNGIEFCGNRIESKRIEDGDVFYLCDYELRFTYQS